LDVYAHFFFFFSSRRRHTRSKRDWSSDVCSSDLVIDLEGNEYPIQVTSTNENETNGNQSLSATILATKVNKSFIADIAEMWRIVDHDNVEHKIIYAKRKGIGAYKREYDYVQSDDTYFLSPAQPVKKTEKKLKQSTNL